jgi:hypothetical protein
VSDKAAPFACCPPIYKEELNDIEGQINQAVEDNQSRYIMTDHIHAGSLLDEGNYKIYHNGSMNFRTFFRVLKTSYSEYKPGKPLKIPVVGGVPRGLGIQIELDHLFTSHEFDSMVDSLWDDVDTYSLEKSRDRLLNDGSATNTVDDVIDALKQILILSMMRIYGIFLMPGLKRSYSINNGQQGIRFYQYGNKSYIDISGGVTQHKEMLTVAERVAKYLDAECLSSIASS